MLAGSADIARGLSGFKENDCWKGGRQITPVEARLVEALFFVGLGSDRLEVFGFEDLPAVEALHVVHAISTGEDDCSLMLAGGLHIQRFEIRIIVMIRGAMSRVCNGCKYSGNDLENGCGCTAVSITIRITL
jgi:hypothetical protein